MCHIHFRRMPLEEAEKCIAEIWTFLEEYQLPTPTMSFDCLNARTTSFTIKLDDALAKSMLMTRLLHLSQGVRGAARLPSAEPDLSDDPPTISDDGMTAPLGVILAMSARTAPRPRRR